MPYGKRQKHVRAYREQIPSPGRSTVARSLTRFAGQFGWVIMPPR